MFKPNNNNRTEFRVFQPIILFHDSEPQSNPHEERIQRHKKHVQEMLNENSQLWRCNTFQNSRGEENFEQDYQIFDRRQSTIGQISESLPTSPLTDSIYLHHPNSDQSIEGPLTHKPAKRRRGNLPKATTALLKNWLAQHKKHPYPTEEEKLHLAKETRLNLQQISNWFINARRRHLPNLLENDFVNGQPIIPNPRNGNSLFSSYDVSDNSDCTPDNGRPPTRRQPGTKCARIQKAGAIKKPMNRRRKPSL
ncbi:hypothetical protein G9A89_017551 [Geosiphon pyriformis]|nr:hypothetical protein G9A89_017551 [Geosiphon pyriformis]